MWHDAPMLAFVKFSTPRGDVPMTSRGRGSDDGTVDVAPGLREFTNFAASQGRRVRRGVVCITTLLPSNAPLPGSP